MRKIFALLASLIAGAGLVAVLGGSAEAAPAPAPVTTSKMSNDNCINPTEKSNLRLGMTTKQVNAATKAHPWFHQNTSIDGTRYAVYVYDDCRPNSGKVVGVAYRVNYYGVQRLALVRYFVM